MFVKIGSRYQNLDGIASVTPGEDSLVVTYNDGRAAETLKDKEALHVLGLIKDNAKEEGDVHPSTTKRAKDELKPAKKE